MHCSEVLHLPLSKKNSNVMVDGPDDFRHMPLERSAEHGISPINSARNVGAYLWWWHLHHRSRRAQVHRKAGVKHQESDGYVFKCGYSLVLGSLHRIQVDAARAAFKLSRGHNGTLAMLAPWHASSNIDSAFRLRRHVESTRLTQTWRRRGQLSKEHRDGWRC